MLSYVGARMHVPLAGRELSPQMTQTSTRPAGDAERMEEGDEEQRQHAARSMCDRRGVVGRRFSIISHQAGCATGVLLGAPLTPALSRQTHRGFAVIHVCCWSGSVDQSERFRSVFFCFLSIANSIDVVSVPNHRKN